VACTAAAAAAAPAARIAEKGAVVRGCAGEREGGVFTPSAAGTEATAAAGRWARGEAAAVRAS
jgi:hypothetical protein